MKNILFRFIPILILAILVAMPSLSSADTLTLKDGQVLKGKFIGMAGGNYKFEALGNTMEIEADKVQSLDVGDQAPAPAAQPAPAAPAPAAPTAAQPAQAPAPPAPAAAQVTGMPTVAAGTDLMVKMGTTIMTGKSNKGDPFTAVLERPVIVDGKTVLPSGTKFYGKIVEAVAAGRVRGQAKLVIQLVEIETKGGIIPINVQKHEYLGPKSDTLRKVAVGAAVGNVTSDDGYKKGAQQGAAIGGAAAVMSSGKQIGINSGTLLEFRLLGPVNVE
jgi:hypothetical protein